MDEAITVKCPKSGRAFLPGYGRLGGLLGHLGRGLQGSVRVCEKEIFVCVLLLAVWTKAYTQIVPDAPVKNFRMPHFGKNGYTQWVLQGGKGIYDNEEQIRVENMLLRVYSGDERMVSELSLESPEALIRLKESRAFSEASIVIAGSNFKISGKAWEWSGPIKEIIVKEDVIVEFTQGIADSFFHADEVGSEWRRTEIRSDRLILRTTPDEYYFRFTGDVSVVSDQMNLDSQELIVQADSPKKREEGTHAMLSEELDSIRQVIAQGKVVLLQNGKTVQADYAEFFPREQKIQLEGAAGLKMEGAYLSGRTIHMRPGELVLLGEKEGNPAEMRLEGSDGLGILGTSAINSETLILADRITLSEMETENHFLSEGSVRVSSGSVKMSSQSMRVVADKLASKDPESVDDSDLKFGEIQYMTADGTVRIDRNGQMATGEKLIFKPKEEQAVLTGNPKLKNSEAIVSGQTMRLKRDFMTVSGDAIMPVVVRLPEMPNLGYEVEPSNETESTHSVPDTEPEETVITSRLLEMIQKPEETLFRFTGRTEIAATNLDASCDRLDVIAKDSVERDAQSDIVPEVERIEAYGNVLVKQSNRTATAQKAFILPKEERVILEGQPVVKDERGEVSGHRMILNKGQRRAIVEGGGPEGKRARIRLQGLSGED